jgi:hypothetical protein
MNPNITKRLLLLICLLMFLPAPIVLADTGPKPNMDFEFRQEFAGEPVTIVSGILYECDQSDCSDGAPIEEVGPQGFRCQANACSAVGYGFAPIIGLKSNFQTGRRVRAISLKRPGSIRNIPSLFARTIYWSKHNLVRRPCCLQGL